MEKKIDLFISVLSIIEVVCCFTPFCLDEEYWKYQQSPVYHGRSTLDKHNGINIFGNSALLGKPLAILFLCAAIAVVVFYLLKMMDKSNSKIIGKAWVMAIIHTVLMVVFLLYTCSIAEVDHISYRYEYGINWMFYIIIILNIVVLVFAILLKFGKMHEMAPQKTTATTFHKETADDLMAYKNLLDSGVITQEEFEKKKEKILGL